MNSDRDSIVVKHLENWIEELERKLAYPKNDWKRKEQLTSQLAEAQQRLKSMAGPSPRGRNSSNNQRLTEGDSPLRDVEPDVSRKRPISLNYP